MGKGALKKRVDIAIAQGKIGAVLNSNATHFVYNGDVNLTPLAQMDLNGATLIFNGNVDLQALKHVNFGGAHVHFNSSSRDLSFQPSNCGRLEPPTKEGNANNGRFPDVTSSLQRPQVGHSSSQPLVNRPALVPQPSNSHHLKPTHRPATAPQVVFEHGQMKVKTGGNQQPIGPSQRIVNWSVDVPKPDDAHNPTNVSESPLDDPTYIHPSRIEQLEDFQQHPPSEDGEISDSLSTTAKSAHTRPRNPERESNSFENGRWTHDRYEDDNNNLVVSQKRSQTLNNEGIAIKKPKLSSVELNLGDQANRLAAKELAMRMRLKARHRPESSSNSAEEGKIHEISQQRAELHGQMTRQQDDGASMVKSANNDVVQEEGRSASASPGRRASLRINRDSLPRASPLANVGRLAHIQEEIVQTRVQCALAGKEVKQEQVTWGGPSDAAVQNSRDKHHVLQELVNKRDVIKKDQSKLEAFNNGIQLPIIKREEDVQMPAIKGEEHDNSRSDEMQHIPPFIKQENVDPALSRATSQEPRPPRRSVRFNLNDVETLIDSVQRSY